MSPIRKNGHKFRLQVANWMLQAVPTPAVESTIVCCVASFVVKLLPD